VKIKNPPCPLTKGEFSQLAFNFGNKKYRFFPKDFPSQFNSYASKDANPPYKGIKGDLEQKKGNEFPF